MARALTSWKEIAEYLGKGVRTVQRWERTMGLPVRRPGGYHKGIVFVLIEDLDAWLRQQHKRQDHTLQDEVERLRAALTEVLAENQLLRTELEAALRQAADDGQKSAPPHVLIQRSARLVRDSHLATQMYAETIERSKNLLAIFEGLKIAPLDDLASKQSSQGNGS